MKLILNGQFFIQKTTGQQRYAKEILSELDKIIQKDEITIVVPKKSVVPAYKNLKIVYFGNIKNRLWEQLCLPFYLCDSAILNALSATKMSHIVFNDLLLINKTFDRNAVLKANLSKWINPIYGSSLFRTFCLLPWKLFTGFHDPHWAYSYLKTTLEEVWAEFPKELEATMNSKFRSDLDLNQWLFRYWQLCKGNFVPQSPKRAKAYFDMTYPAEKICAAIKSPRIKEIVLNDNDVPDFEQKMEKITQAFQSILPEKSSFEV